jgi:hypothetical protein
MVQRDFGVRQTGETPPELQWEQTYGGRFTDEQANSVIETNEGEYLFAGHTESGPKVVAKLVKVDTEGFTQWENRYDIHYSQSPNVVIETSNGGYLFAGRTESIGNSGTDVWLVKVDTEGTVRWEQTYGGDGTSEANSVIETSDGNYLLAGKTTPSEGGQSDALLMEVSPDGRPQWERAYGVGGADEINSLVETSDGSYLLAGGKSSESGGLQAWVVKVDTEGAIQWEQTYGGDGNDWANPVIETADGSYLVANVTESIGNGEGDAWLVNVDTDGVTQWEKTYGGNATDWPNTLIETSDGGYLFAGTTASVGSAKNDGWLVKIDTEGTIQWEQTYGEAEENWGYSVIETSDRSYLLAGESVSEQSPTDAWLVKIGDGDDATTPYVNTPTESKSAGVDGDDTDGDGENTRSPRTSPGRNGNGAPAILFPILGAGSVGWVIGFFTGNTENKTIRRDFLNILLVGFGSVGMVGLLRWFLEPGGDEVALLVAVLTLGLFAGLLVGMVLREQGITILSRE